MQDQVYHTKNRRVWQYFDIESRKKLEGLAADFLFARGHKAKYARFPARRWAPTYFLNNARAWAGSNGA